MLLAIRDRATGVIAWIIVILLIIPFALWGLHEYYGGGQEPDIAEVNDVPIPRTAFLAEVDQTKRTLPNPPEGEEELRLRREVLDRLISQEVLIQAVADAGMRVGDAQVAAYIRSMGPFQRDGQFDQELYERVLSSNRLSPQGFEAQQAREMVARQLLAGLSASALASEQQLKSYLRLRDRTLDVAYTVMPLAPFAERVKVSDAEVREYYQNHDERFMIPEAVRLNYVKLDPQEMAAGETPDERSLRQTYEQRRAELYRPEQRHAGLILLELPADADEQAETQVRQQAQNLRERIVNGESFEQLAREFSDHETSRERGGELGAVEPGSRSEAFELALAELREGEVSEAVRIPQGYALIKLTRLVEGGTPSFEEVRDQLAEEARMRAVEGRFYEESERLYDLTYENPLTLEVAARELGLEIRETGWIPRDGTDEGLGARARVVEAAFSDEVLAQGRLDEAVNSRLIELIPDDDTAMRPAVVVRVQEYRPAERRPLEEVRGDIVEQLRLQKAQEQALAQADEIVSRLQGGASLEEIAQQNQWQLQQVEDLRRNDSRHRVAVARTAFDEFSAARSLPQYATGLTQAGDAVIVQIKAMQEGQTEELEEAEQRRMRSALEQARGITEVELFLDDLRRRADVTVFEDVLSREDE